MTNNIFKQPYLAHRLSIAVLLVFVAIVGSFGQCTLSGTGTILWNNASPPACQEGGTADQKLIIIIPVGVNLEFNDNGDTWTGLGIIVNGTLSITAPGQVTINGSIIIKSTGSAQITGKLEMGSADPNNPPPGYVPCNYQLNIEAGGVLNIVGSTPDRLNICGVEISRGGVAGCSTFPSLPLPYCEPSAGFTGPLGLNKGGVTGGINPLPVELLFFKAVSSESQVDLKWATATERNSDYFAIEKSVNGKDFTEIGSVKAAGNSIFRKDYSFTDNFPLLGRSYYRLKQVDLNGDFEYFNITFADLEGSRTASVYPNPLEQNQLQFKLNYSTEEEVFVKIYNSNGQVVKSFSFYGSFYNDHTDLKSGAYLMKIAAGKEKHTRRFVIP